MYYVEIVDDLIPRVRDLMKKIVDELELGMQVLRAKVIEIELYKYDLLYARGYVLCVDDEANFVVYHVTIVRDGPDRTQINIERQYGKYEFYEKLRDAADLLEGYENEISWKSFKRVKITQKRIWLDGEMYEA